MEEDTLLLPPTPAPPVPRQRVTFTDQPHPVPQQRVLIEQLPDDPPPSLQPVPANWQACEPEPPHRVLPPPPWFDYDVASATGTALLVPTTTAAFTNPNTANRAAQLSARIDELQAELAVSRAYYGS